MDQSQEGSLGELIVSIRESGRGDTVSIADLLETFGRRGFGALLLIPALIVVTPLSTVPGLSSLCGVMIALISAQYLIGRRSVWLPSWIRHRTIARGQLLRASEFLAGPARMIDRVLAQRLQFLTRSPCSLALVGICFVLGAIMPLFEFVPMSSSLLAGAVALLSLALFTRDGALALVGLGYLAAVVYLVSGLVRWVL